MKSPIFCKQCMREMQNHAVKELVSCSLEMIECLAKYNEVKIS